MSDVFNDDNTNDNENVNDPNFLDQLVGEGKKFKTVEDLARGKAESDRYVDQLRTELETERKLNEEKLDRLLKSLENKRDATPAGGNNTNGSDTSNTPNGRSKDGNNTNSNDASDDNIESLVKKALREEQDLTRKEANRQVVNTKLDEMFGEKASSVVRAKAKELEVPLERLKEMAETSPKAFLTLIAGEDRTTKSFSSTQSKVNSESLGVNKPNDENGWSYYKDLKRKNPAEFWKRHHEIYEKVQSMGHDKFYNS